MVINITINERITDLRTMSGLSQKELANFFNVSTDYLLGLTNVKFKKNVELSELGLSNKVLFALLAGSVNGALLSRIIEHPHFVTLLDTADAYFKDAHKAGIQTRNDVINLATASLKDFMKEHPENRIELSHDICQLNAEKISGDEADLNKLRNIFMSILKDIKADYGNVPQDIEATEFQEMLAEIKTQSDDIQAKHPVTETILQILLLPSSSVWMLWMKRKPKCFMSFPSIYLNVCLVVLIEKTAKIWYNLIRKT